LRVLLVLLSVLVSGTPAQPRRLEARFIGQMAVTITDGTVTLITDFPYQIGYAEGPPYADTEIRSFKTPTLALITHKHLDHWEPRLFARTDWKVLGPADATRPVAAGRVLPPSARVTFGPMEIEPIETPHAGIGHYSYVVTWHGRRLYFSGDTDNAASLTAAKNLDVAFVSPWLYHSVQRSGARIDARQVVIYHHRAGQQVPGCATGCVAPRQGETIQIPGPI
jgi:L-ascorbate metabolism protein UlaG (beta-lactamase superfamily)